jgi:cyclopropane-fatty-acyl-phospholipid synthase
MLGTGWASLAILAAQTAECTVVTITLSENQTVLARQKIAEAGLSDRITVHTMDFRECLDRPEWKGSFDKFISVEMMEHVGKDYMKDYWHVVDWALKEGTGVGVIQCITMPEARKHFLGVLSSFFQL